MARRGKDKSEVEHLKGQIRELESQVRRLQKQLRRQEKESLSHDIDILNELLEQEIQEIPKNKKCPLCYDGHIIVSDLGIKTLEKCNQCSYRKTRNK